jgi:hypothetical protein
MDMKKGRISKEEEAFIGNNLSSKTPRQIAEELDRDPESVNAFIRRKFKIGVSEEEMAAFELENRPYWSELELQFTEGELELFKYHWSRIISQFKDDVVPTEELQVVDLIKIELLMNRCLKQNRDNIDQISAYERLITEERARDPDQQDREAVFNLERQVASLKASQESLNRDYRELQSKKSTMLKEMKATREQRVKRFEDSKQSFSSWIVHLMTNPDLVRKYGLEMEKMRLAILKEKERLSAFHQYADGQVDQPLLTPENIKD